MRLLKSDAKIVSLYVIIRLSWYTNRQTNKRAHRYKRISSLEHLWDVNSYGDLCNSNLLVMCLFSFQKQAEKIKIRVQLVFTTPKYLNAPSEQVL